MHTTNHSDVCLWYVPTLAYLWYLERVRYPVLTWTVLKIARGRIKFRPSSLSSSPSIQQHLPRPSSGVVRNLNRKRTKTASTTCPNRWHPRWYPPWWVASSLPRRCTPSRCSRLACRQRRRLRRLLLSLLLDERRMMGRRGGGLVFRGGRLPASAARQEVAEREKRQQQREE